MRAWWEEWKTGLLILTVSAAVFTLGYELGYWFVGAAVLAFYAAAAAAWALRRRRGYR